MSRTFRRIVVLALLVIPALAACGNGITDEDCYTDRDSRQYICPEEN